MLHVVSTTPLQYRLGYRKLGSHKFNQELSKTLSTYLPPSLPTYYLQQAPHDIDDAKASNVDLNNNKQTTTAKQLGIYMCSSSICSTIPLINYSLDLCIRCFPKLMS